MSWVPRLVFKPCCLRTPARLAYKPWHPKSVARASGLALVETLAAVALLVVLLGFMVLLARHVRQRSADRLTGQILELLERTVRADAHLQQVLDEQAPPLVRAGQDTGDPSEMRQRAEANNRAVVQALLLAGKDTELRKLPLAIYDQTAIRDAWGSPIVYMPSGAPGISMAAQRRSFFLSAGPDRSFSTLGDNLYSYEQPWQP
jgi:hypothetical protein